MIYHYVYEITHIETNKKYIGSRTSKTSPENDLGIKYFSSSRDKDFVTDQKQNPQNYKYKVLKIFDTREAANLHEILLHNEYDVGINEEYYNRAKSPNGRFASSGQVSVKDKDGSYLRVSVNDPRYISGELVHNHTGYIPVMDKDGNTFKVTKNDPRLLNGELHHVNTGRVSVRLENGETKQVSLDDPKYIDGTYKHICSGTVPVKDKDGNIFTVPKDDPKYLSGELVGMFSNTIRMTDGKKTITVSPDKEEEYILKGYRRGMIKNFKEQRIWMTDGVRNYGVYLSDVDKKLEEGLHHGVTRNIPKKPLAKIMNDGIKNHTVLLKDIDGYLSKGFVIGRLNKKTNTNKGKIAINNGTEMKKIDPSELQEYLNNGYTKGGLHGHKAKKPMTWMNDGNIETHVSDHLVEDYIKAGYKKGRL